VMFNAPTGYATGEIARVAIAFAKTERIADSFGGGRGAFAPGQGPTAHVLPLPPIFAGTIYRLFGIRSPTSEFMLEVTAVLLALASSAFLYKGFGFAGMRRRERLVALAAVCLLPLPFLLETVEFRIWEGAMATCLAFGFVCLLGHAETRRSHSWRMIAALSLLAAVTFFVHPSLGLACYLCALLFAVEDVRRGRLVGTALIAVAALVVVLAPWAARNAAVMGKPILLRSNFGLELALANYPGALAPGDPKQRFRRRLAEIHPAVSPTAFAAMERAGGEVAYADKLGASATAWIRQNPGAFARLCFRHLGEYYFPPTWHWNIYIEHGWTVLPKAALQWLISALALSGIAYTLLTSARRYRYLIIMAIVPTLPYMIVQPVPRYRYIVYGLSLFFAVRFMAWMLARVRARLGQATEGVAVGRTAM
jgi:hypothetical protein